MTQSFPKIKKGGLHFIKKGNEGWRDGSVIDGPGLIFSIHMVVLNRLYFRSPGTHLLSTRMQTKHLCT